MLPMRDGRTNERRRTREDRATQPMDAGWLSFATIQHSYSHSLMLHCRWVLVEKSHNGHAGMLMLQWEVAQGDKLLNDVRLQTFLISFTSPIWTSVVLIWVIQKLFDHKFICYFQVSTIAAVKQQNHNSTALYVFRTKNRIKWKSLTS